MLWAEEAKYVQLPDVRICKLDFAVCFSVQPGLDFAELSPIFFEVVAKYLISSFNLVESLGSSRSHHHGIARETMILKWREIEIKR